MAMENSKRVQAVYLENSVMPECSVKEDILRSS